MLLLRMLLFSMLVWVWMPLGAKAAAIPLTRGMKIASRTILVPGAYTLNDPGKGVAQVTGSDFVVELQGAKLRGPGTRQGIGLHITDARNVTIKNADVRGYLWGIVIERSVNVRLVNCVVSNNADLPPGTVIDESGRQSEDQHGGGILLRDSRDCLVSHCTAQHQWDGIDVIRSDNNRIEDGDYSYNNNWGLHLWDSSRNTFRRNRAVWCTTGEGTLFQALTGWQTYDAQAVGIDHNSNENLIEANDLRFGGDAIFIRANEGPIVPGVIVPPRNGSHRNILHGNDCSFSPNNAIEVDFADDTVIENNNCSFSNYGMWLGYSRRCKVRGNICLNDSSKAIEIENGQNDVFENNLFGYDKPRPNQKLIYLRQNGRDKTPSGPYQFKYNVFYGVGEIPIALKETVISISGDVALNDAFNGGEAMKTEIYIPPRPVSGQTSVSMTGQSLFRLGPDSKPVVQPPATITAGRSVTLRGIHLGERTTGQNGTMRPCAVEIEGIPVWVQSAEPEQITFCMPTDFWDRVALSQVTLRVFNGLTWSEPIAVKVSWPENGRPRIDSIASEGRFSAAVTAPIWTISGANLNGPNLRVLFDGKPGTIRSASAGKIVVSAPDSPHSGKSMKSWNLIVQHGQSDNVVKSWPIAINF